MRESHKRIFEEVKKELDEDGSGHDAQHVKRVYNQAMSIAEEEGGDKDVIGAAALTHDIHRVMGDSFTHPADSIHRIGEVLDRAGYEGNIHEVFYCVAVHEEYGFEEGNGENYSLEAEIVQDADNLDAMGAVGIGRTFKFGGAHGNPMWVPEEDLDRDEYDKQNMDDSTIQHFYDKLLSLKDNMNTDTAQQKAEERHQFMEEFVERFKEEWK